MAKAPKNSPPPPKPASTPVKRSIVEGETAKPAEKRADAGGTAAVDTAKPGAAGVGEVPPPADIEARRKAAAEKLAGTVADDTPLESDNPADTGNAKPVEVASEKPKKKRGGASKSKEDASPEEKAAKKAAKKARKDAEKEAERKKQTKATRDRAEKAEAGEYEAAPDAPETDAPRPRTTGGATPPEKANKSDQLNLIPRLLGATWRGVKQINRLRNDALLTAGAIGTGAAAVRGIGAAGGIKGIVGGAGKVISDTGNYLWDGSSGEDKESKPAATQPAAPTAPADPAGKPQTPGESFRRGLFEKRDSERAVMPASRAEQLMKAIKYRRIV